MELFFFCFFAELLCWLNELAFSVSDVVLRHSWRRVPKLILGCCNPMCFLLVGCRFRPKIAELEVLDLVGQMRMSSTRRRSSSIQCPTKRKARHGRPIHHVDQA